MDCCIRVAKCRGGSISLAVIGSRIDDQLEFLTALLKLVSEIPEGTIEARCKRPEGLLDLNQWDQPISRSAAVQGLADSNRG